MTKALAWIRSKATLLYEEEVTMTPQEALDTESEIGPGTYRITCTKFDGTVPYRMARELSGSKLTKTEAEWETLHLGTGYRGGEGKCSYTKRVYVLLQPYAAQQAATG